jgi:hypothetical protein
MLYSYPGSVYFAAALGLAVTVWLLRCRRCDRDFSRRSFVRFLVACCVAALVYLPLVSPAVPQVVSYLPRIRGALGSPWLVVTWTEYATGVMMPPFSEILEWKAAHPVLRASEVASIWLADARCLVEKFLPRAPLLFMAAFLLVPALMMAGIRHLVRRSRTCLPLVAAGLAAPMIAYVYHLWPQTPILFYWYLIYSLPVVLALVAAGLDGAGEWLAVRWRRRHSHWVPAVVFFAVFAIVIAGGPGRSKWWPGRQRSPVAYARGPFLYVTHPDGTTERIPPDDPRRRASKSAGNDGTPTSTMSGLPVDSPDASMFRER